MKTYVDVYINSRYRDQNDFISALQKFCGDVDRWKYLEEQSIDYTKMMGTPSCAILHKDNSNHPAIAITTNSNSNFFVANIVPKESGQITMDEYNQVAVDFVQSLRRYAKSRRLNFSIKLTKSEIGLKEIISGKKCRDLFERYLGLHPTSYHPLDIERLDVFICCLSRHARKHIDFDLLEGWLCQENGWSTRDASWCVDRIRTGLSILKVNRGFY